MESVIAKKEVTDHSANEMVPAEASENDDGSVYFDTLSDFISTESQDVDHVDDQLSLHLKTLLNIPVCSSSNEASDSLRNDSMTSGSVACPESYCNDEYRNEISEMGFQNVDSPSSSSTSRKSLQSLEHSEFVPPSDELAEEILMQVENSFSDFSVLKDRFLLRHIQGSKDGYVSVKFVASFRPVKALTRDWRVVQYCLQRSTKLELNEQKNKLRRVIPVPKFEDTVFAKTVLVFNPPFGKQDSESIRLLLSFIGEITKVIVIHPGDSQPEIITKRCLKTYRPFIQNKAFAIVEFETLDSAKNAVSIYENLNNDETLLTIVPLMSDAYKIHSKPSSEDNSKSPNVNLKTCPQSEGKKRTNRTSNRRNSSGKKQTKSEKLRQSQFESFDGHSSQSAERFDTTNSHANLHEVGECKLTSPSAIHERKTFHSSFQSLYSPPYQPSQPLSYSHRNASGFFDLRNVGPLTMGYPYSVGSPPETNSFQPRYNKSKSLTSSPVHTEQISSYYPFAYYLNFASPSQHQEPSPPLQYQNRMHKSYLHPKSPGCLGSHSHLPPNVIRWPKGPDGTNGFHDESRRMRLVLNL